MRRLLIGFIGALAASTAVARELPSDPLGSVMWTDMAERFFADGAIVFDQRVRVMVPQSAENQMLVPVTVDATGLNGVEEIVAIADLNPIAHVLTYRPSQARPFIAFRLKVEQATPIRVGVRTSDGTWHVGGAWIDAAGGGCTAPAAAHSTANWTKTLGQTRALAMREDAGTARVTIRMRHPMDTGLADGIPVFHMKRVSMTDGDGAVIAEVDLSEPVSENPTLTLRPQVAAAETSLAVHARDTEGNTFDYALAIPAAEGN